MSSGKQVKVTIDALGGFTVKTEGYVGQSCIQATQKLEDLLTPSAGGKNVTLDDSYYQEEQQQAFATN